MDFLKARKKKGYTQEETAQRAGISLMAYQLIERGTTRNPRKQTLNRLKEILGNETTGNQTHCNSIG